MVRRGRECVPVLPERVDVGHQILYGGTGFEDHVVGNLERMFYFSSPLFVTVALEALDLQLPRPDEGEIELRDLGGAAQKDDLPSDGRVPKTLFDGLLTSHAVEDQREAAAQVHFVSDDGHVRLRAGVHQGLPCLVTRRHDPAGAESLGQGLFVGTLHLGDELALVAGRPESPDHAEGDGTAPDDQDGAVGEGAAAQCSVHSDGKGLDEDGAVVAHLVGHGEELLLVCDHRITPTTRQIRVVPDDQPRLDGLVVDDGLARPILIGRPEVIAKRIEKFGLRLEVDRDFEVCNPESDPRYDQYWRFFHSLVERRGITPDAARTIIRTNNTAIAACMVAQDEADGMLCGVQGRFAWHLRYVLDIIGKASGVRDVSSLSALVIPKGVFFFCDTHITENPTAEELAEMVVMAATEVRRFGVTPKIALLSHSDFGTHDSESAIKMRRAAELLRERNPDLMVEGEMHADTALDTVLRERVFPNSRLNGPANMFVMPNVDAAHIAFNTAKQLADGLPLGPIMIGAAKPVHVLTTSVTARGIVNMTGVAVVEAQEREHAQRLML